MAWIIAVRNENGDDIFSLYSDDEKELMQRELVVDMGHFPEGYLAEVKMNWSS